MALEGQYGPLRSPQGGKSTIFVAENPSVSPATLPLVSLMIRPCGGGGGYVWVDLGPCSLKSPFEALVGIHRVVGIVGTYGALLLGTCFGKGSIPLVSGRWDPGYFREIYMFFFKHGQKKWCLLETQNRRPKTNETKPSVSFAKENHLPFSIHLHDCGRCHYFFGSHLLFCSPLLFC